MALTQL